MLFKIFILLLFEFPLLNKAKIVKGSISSILNLTSTIGETINLYAQWETSSVNYTPERTGYTFEGWYKDSACTEQVTTAENTEYTPKEDITLYAKWTKNLTKGNVTIKKYRTGTEIGLKGAIIGLFNQNGEAILGIDGEQIRQYNV